MTGKNRHRPRGSFSEKLIRPLLRPWVRGEGSRELTRLMI